MKPRATDIGRRVKDPVQRHARSKPADHASGSIEARHLKEGLGTLSAHGAAYHTQTLAEAADVIEHADISAAEGFLRKTGAGAYTAHKSNLNAAADPTVNDDSGDGYSVGSIWINTTASPAKVFVCCDATVGAAEWIEVSGAGGGVHANEMHDPDMVAVTGAQNVAGVKTFADGILTDTVGEETPDAGVTIDSLLIKDGRVYLSSTVYLALVTGILHIQGASGDNLQFNPATNQWYFNIGGNAILTINDTACSFGAALNMQDYALTNIGDLGFGNPGSLTIAADAITVTKTFHSLRGAGSAADDLATITGGNAGSILILTPGGAEDITVKHGTGNIYLNDNADLVLDEATDDMLVLIKVGSNWYEVCRAMPGGGGDASTVTYTPAVATDWDGDADPGNTDDALDQLAERVDDLEGAGGGVYPPLQVIIGDGQNVIQTGLRAWIRVPWACTVTAWYIAGDVNDADNDIVVDIRRIGAGAFPPITSIAGTSKPNLGASQDLNSDTNLSEWSDVTLDAGDWLGFYVEATPAELHQVTVSLEVTA